MRYVVTAQFASIFWLRPIYWPSCWLRSSYRGLHCSSWYDQFDVPDIWKLADGVPVTYFSSLRNWFYSAWMTIPQLKYVPYSIRQLIIKMPLTPFRMTFVIMHGDWSNDTHGHKASSLKSVGVSLRRELRAHHQTAQVAHLSAHWNDKKTKSYGLRNSCKSLSSKPLERKLGIWRLRNCADPRNTKCNGVKNNMVGVQPENGVSRELLTSLLMV